MSYNTKNYKEQGGDKWVIGGSLEIKDNDGNFVDIVQEVGSMKAATTNLSEDRLIEPDGFDWRDSPIHGKIIKTSKDVLCNLNTTQYDIGKSGITYYVNQSTGSNSNDGLTPETAFKDFLTAYNKSDVGTIMIVGKTLYRNTFMNGGKIEKSISIKSWSGAFICNAEYGQWELAPEQTNTYVRVVENASVVIDANTNKITEAGDFFTLTRKSSIAEVEATKSSFYIDADTNSVYVHSHTDAEPPSSFYVLRDGDAPAIEIEIADGVIAYFENINVGGGFHVTGEGLCVARKCSFKWGRNAFYNKDGNTILDNCLAALATNDGFCYGSGTSTKGIEINCVGRDNGDGSNSTSNGSTSHTGCRVIRCNCEYYGNNGPNVADVYDSQSWNIKCISHDSETGRGFANDSSSTSGKMFLDACKGYDNTSDLYIAAGTTMYIRDCEFATISINGTAVSY